jgi:hypothetical protein
VNAPCQIQNDVKILQAMAAAVAGLIVIGVVGCQNTAVVNIGGTVNTIPVTKSNHGGDMTSATDPTQSNPSTTTIKLPVTP